jgi:hypothetical protein
MRVEVRLFGGLADRVGSPRLDVELPSRRDRRPSCGPRSPRRTRPSRRCSRAPASPWTSRWPATSGRSATHGRWRCCHRSPGAPGSGRPAVGGCSRGCARPRSRSSRWSPRWAVRRWAASSPSSGPVRDHAPDLDGVVGLEYSAYPEMAERVLADDRRRAVRRASRPARPGPAPPRRRPRRGRPHDPDRLRSRPPGTGVRRLPGRPGAPSRTASRSGSASAPPMATRAGSASLAAPDAAAGCTPAGTAGRRDQRSTSSTVAP